MICVLNEPTLADSCPVDMLYGSLWVKFLHSVAVIPELCISGDYRIKYTCVLTDKVFNWSFAGDETRAIRCKSNDIRFFDLILVTEQAVFEVA